MESIGIKSARLLFRTRAVKIQAKKESSLDILIESTFPFSKFGLQTKVCEIPAVIYGYSNSKYLLLYGCFCVEFGGREALNQINFGGRGNIENISPLANKSRYLRYRSVFFRAVDFPQRLSFVRSLGDVVVLYAFTARERHSFLENIRCRFADR